MALALHDPCPPFALPGTDDEVHELASFQGTLLVVIVSCNHCPHVAAYEPRMVALCNEYQPKRVDFVAVNANDASRYPEDDMAHMKERAIAREYPFPYLRDERQAFVRALGAEATPEVFVFDAARKLRYHGRIDDSRDPSRVTSHDLRNALDALLASKDPPVAETFAVGCSVKWK